MAADDRAAEALAAIRESRANSMIGGLFRPTVAQLDLDVDDLPRLLAAVEDVRRLAIDWEGRAAETYQTAIRAADRGALPERVEALTARAKTLNDAAVKLRAVIERALTGEEATDG